MPRMNYHRRYSQVKSPKGNGWKLKFLLHLLLLPFESIRGDESFVILRHAQQSCATVAIFRCRALTTTRPDTLQ